MDRTVDIIVKKAQMQEPFAFMYANLCKKITNAWNAILIESSTVDTSESAAAGDEEKESNSYGKQFRFKLLSRCQQEFQVDRAAAIADIRARTDLSAEDREEQEILMKMKFNGHMRFVGEIYAQDLVRANIMIACLKDFISAPDEANLVCMCRLFETLGKKLEDYCISKKKTRHFTEIFDEIQKFIDSKEGTFSSRVRYLLKDLIDLRANKWQPRIQVQKASKVTQEKEAPKSTPKPAPSSGDARKGTPGLSVNIPAGGSKTPPPASPSDWQVVATKNKSKDAPSAKGSIARSASTSTINEKKSPFGGSSAKPAASVNNKFATLDENSPLKNKSSGSGAGAGSGGIKSSKSFSGQGKAEIPVFSPRRESDKEEVEIDFLGESREEEVDVSAELADSSSSSEELPEGFSKKVIGRVNEYYLKEATLAEVCSDLKDLVAPASNFPSAAVKIILGYVVEASETHRVAACEMFNYLAQNNILLADHFSRGIYAFLDGFDDLLVDNPKLLSCLSPMFARFCAVYGIVSLSMLKSLPEGNMFSKVSDLIAGTLQSVSTLVSVEKAKEVYMELDYDFSEYSPSPDAVAAYLKKFHIDNIVTPTSDANNTI